MDPPGSSLHPVVPGAFEAFHSTMHVEVLGDDVEGVAGTAELLALE